MSLCFKDIETDAVKCFLSLVLFFYPLIHSLLWPLKAANPWNLPLNLPLLSALICFFFFFFKSKNSDVCLEISIFFNYSSIIAELFWMNQNFLEHLRDG